ncbi:hypothetical protein [Hymenobacter sublimis]|uniref:Rubredoxin-like domain-containing protein n=1 Tax=Hymenobacter sublimis TaxID=2933777 RepID=A0ABY4J627_9BACT|nr:hypothetical protein [Hymenobacter sublimis]UPL47851.1 hypothetical protein MWH26_11660 [Hymenobacter sublimis]
MELWYCRVCGLDYDESPWGPDGHSPDYSTCACCGVVFGYDDYTPNSARGYRAQWLAAGAVWFYPNMKPQNWQMNTQLQQVPARYH